MGSPSPRTITIANVNCRSMLRKQADIHDLIDHHQADILCITETWLNHSTSNDALDFANFQIYQRDRESCTEVPWSNQGGGGVAILVNKNIVSKEISHTIHNVELLMVEVQIRHKKYLVIGIYRPPRQPVQAITDALTSLQELIETHSCILIGDFNAKHSEWHSSDTTDTPGRHLSSAFIQHGFTLLNPGTGTRPRGLNDGSTLLDLTLTNDPNLSSSATTQVLAPLSDHCPVITKFDIELPTTKPNYRLVRIIDYALARSMLTREPLIEKIRGEAHIDFVWQAWDTHVMNVINRCTTWQYKKPKARSTPWFTPRLHKLRTKQNRLYQACQRDRTNKAMWTAYCLVRNVYRKQLRAARQSYFGTMARDLTTGCRKGGYVWWRRMKRLCNIARKIHPMPDLSDGATTAETDEEKAEILATCFASQCATGNPAVDSSPVPVTNASAGQFSLPTIHSSQVLHDLQHLTSRKATSHKELVPFLRNLADLLFESITYIYDLSLTTSTVPRQWKDASINAIYKGKGEASNPANYRPISLLHPVSRLLEKHIARHLQTFLVSESLISSSQFAYVHDRSTTDQLLLLTYKIADAMDRRKQFDCVFLDFEKAFDKVHHPTLLSTLRTIMDTNAFNWMESYLLNRTIKVKVGETASRPRTITSGVPQGSHLAPFLFLLYINTLPNNLQHCTPYLFADDVTLFFFHHSDSSTTNKNNISEDITHCQTWAKQVHGRFSPAKTTILSNHDGTNVTMENRTLAVTETYKHLGITITPDLNFQQHYNRILKIYKQRVNLLCFMGPRLPPSCIILLYKSYVRPAIEYAIPVWYTRLTAEQLTAFDLLQAKICRTFLRAKKIPFARHETKENLNRQCFLESLQYRRQTLSLFLLHKHIYTHPDYLSAFNVSLSKSARRPNKLVFSTHGTTRSKLFIHRIGTLWNCLPPTLTSIESPHTFRKALLKHTYTYQFHCKGIH